jgi:hypothetical protein
MPWLTVHFANYKLKILLTKMFAWQRYGKQYSMILVMYIVRFLYMAVKHNGRKGVQSVLSTVH